MADRFQGVSYQTKLSFLKYDSRYSRTKQILVNGLAEQGSGDKLMYIVGILKHCAVSIIYFS